MVRVCRVNFIGRVLQANSEQNNKQEFTLLYFQARHMKMVAVVALAKDTVRDWYPESIQAKEDSCPHKDGHAGCCGRVQSLLGCGDHTMEGRRDSVLQSVLGHGQACVQGVLAHHCVTCQMT